MIEGANTVLSSSERCTAASASALARKKRVRWTGVAPSAEKKANRSTPADSAARRRRAVARPLSSSTGACG